MGWLNHQLVTLIMGKRTLTFLIDCYLLNVWFLKFTNCWPCPFGLSKDFLLHKKKTSHLRFIGNKKAGSNKNARHFECLRRSSAMAKLFGNGRSFNQGWAIKNRMLRDVLHVFLEKVHLFCSQVWKKTVMVNKTRVKYIGTINIIFNIYYYFCWCCHVNWLRVRILYIFNRPANLGKMGFRVRSSDRWVDPPRSCERCRFLIPKVCPWLVGLYRGWNTTQLYRDYNKPL